VLLAALILGVVPPSVTIGAPGSIDFTRDIRPILADRCFACHGPDGAARKAGLRPEPRLRRQFAPRAKRVIYLIQSGGPSPFETLDPKPGLRARHGTALPESVRRGQRLTGMSGNQGSPPVAAAFCGSARHGRSGIELAELLPHTARVVDDLCIIRSMHTEAINHDPAITFFSSGHQIAGRPSMGALMSYGLGSLNRDLPSFIVLVSKDAARDQPLSARLWGSGFLPSEQQGVQFRSGREPVLALSTPEGVSPHARRAMLDALARIARSASAALVQDLKRRGLLEDTLVVWGGVKAGHVHGATDEFGYNIERDPVHVHDLHATMLRLLGVDHERLTWFHQGRHDRLTDIAGRVVDGVIA
jgi:hypothetical protein